MEEKQVMHNILFAKKNDRQAESEYPDQYDIGNLVLNFFDEG